MVDEQLVAAERVELHGPHWFQGRESNSRGSDYEPDWDTGPPWYINSLVTYSGHYFFNS